MAKRIKRTGSRKAVSKAGQLVARRLDPSDLVIQPANYEAFLTDLKSRIRAAQIRATLSVNRELISLYWHIGNSIVERQDSQGWGKSIVDRLSRDLQADFPGVGGFSPQNIWHMRRFYLAWTAEVSILPQLVGELKSEDLQQLVGEIPWGHNIVLIEKLKDPAQRIWYAKQTPIQGWSRAVLVHQIESDLYHRSGKAVTNFNKTLPPADSDLVHQLLKDPYNFDFLTLAEDAKERDLERGLITHLKNFLLELGVGFAFVGQQHHLEVGGEDFFVDLLFYHLRLRRYVVIDLKVEEFKPEFAGKMNFYLSVIDDQYRHGDDQSSIGLILCKTQNRLIAEYALRDTTKPMGVATYAGALPVSLRGSLPSPEELARELGPLNGRTLNDK